MKREKAFIKEIIVVAVAILILAYFNIDIQTVAQYIKDFINWVLNLFK